jgi:hypothetical protein
MRRDRHDRPSDSAFGVFLGTLLPIVVAALLVPLRDEIASANVALALVVTVVLAAAFGGRVGGVTAAVVSALAFDFFHTRPYLSITIDSQDDVETTVLLLVVGLVVGTIGARAQRARRSAEAGQQEIRRIHRLAELVASGAPAADVVKQAQAELTSMLRLQACRFEAPPYGDVLPRLERSGVIAGRREYRYAGAGFELPAEGVELVVLARGNPVGRFVLTPAPGVGVSLEQRVVAVALADQVGGAFGESRQLLTSQGRLGPERANDA